MFFYGKIIRIILSNVFMVIKAECKTQYWSSNSHTTES